MFSNPEQDARLQKTRRRSRKHRLGLTHPRHTGGTTPPHTLEGASLSALWFLPKLNTNAETEKFRTGRTLTG